MKLRMLCKVMVTICLSVCVGAVLADDAGNPFAEAYKPLTLRAPVAKAEQDAPLIFKGTDDRDRDYQHMLEQGYDLLGYSSFEAGDVPPDRLKEHAREIGAHMVLVTTRRSGDVPAGLKIEQLRQKAREMNADTIDPNVLDQSSVRFTYHASYWVKLVPPLLGLHVRPPTERETADGLVIIAVIQGSPAEKAGLRSQDIILRMGDRVLETPEALSRSAQRYAGQVTEVEFLRDGEVRKTEVKLNPAH
jgi:hypothetical protein